MDRRNCPNCGQPLPHKPGLSNDCKRAVRKEQNRRWREQNPEKTAVQSVRNSLRRKGITNPHPGYVELRAEILKTKRVVKEIAEREGDKNA